MKPSHEASHTEFVRGMPSEAVVMKDMFMLLQMKEIVVIQCEINHMRWITRAGLESACFILKE